MQPAFVPQTFLHREPYSVLLSSIIYHHHHDQYRHHHHHHYHYHHQYQYQHLCFGTCIPAEDEPMLNSSSWYPLPKFTRPFCQNRGVKLPNYVYNRTPSDQYSRNDDYNNAYDRFETLGVGTVSRYFKMDATPIKKCAQNITIFFLSFIFSGLWPNPRNI